MGDNTSQGLTREQKEELEQYARVSQEPRGLPPDREMVHKIPLKEGVDPINVRPY